MLDQQKCHCLYWCTLCYTGKSGRVFPESKHRFLLSPWCWPSEWCAILLLYSRPRCVKRATCLVASSLTARHRRAATAGAQRRPLIGMPIRHNMYSIQVFYFNDTTKVFNRSLEDVCDYSCHNKLFIGYSVRAVRFGTSRKSQIRHLTHRVWALGLLRAAEPSFCRLFFLNHTVLKLLSL
jgi:hypothetical protein